MPAYLSLDERSLLQRLRISESNTVVRLRSALAWDVPRFVTTLVALQERGLLSRDGIHLTLTTDGSNQVRQTVRELGLSHGAEFRTQVDAPRLPVSSLYLPDHGRFLRATQRSLYTHDVSRADPE